MFFESLISILSLGRGFMAQPTYWDLRDRGTYSFRGFIAYKPWSLCPSLPFGLIEDVNIPRGRKGGFVPKVIDRFKAFKKKIAKIVEEMFTLGISTRKIKRITKIIAGNGISKTEASRLNKTIKEEITAWLNRPINKKF